ncbi:GGDEF domain-containing protein [Thermoproteota archaeon]
MTIDESIDIILKEDCWEEQTVKIDSFEEAVQILKGRIDVNLPAHMKPELNSKLIDYIHASHRSLEAELQVAWNHAKQDKVSGLHNRFYFEDVLEHETQRVKRYGGDLALIMFDVDNFKRVNDSFGHVCGDNVLGKVGEAVGEEIRATDIAARYGGDEFAIILPHTSVKEASSLAERLRVRLAGIQHKHNDLKIKNITASFGVSPYSGQDSIYDFIEAADEALYRSKEEGRNQVYICSQDDRKYSLVRYGRREDDSEDILKEAI